jgi:hypothetical protein
MAELSFGATPLSLGEMKTQQGLLSRAAMASKSCIFATRRADRGVKAGDHGRLSHQQLPA